MLTYTAQTYAAGANNNAASITTDAPNCRDAGVDDTSTSHEGAGIGTTQSAEFMIDMGSDKAVDQLRATMRAAGDINGAYQLDSSSNGTTWTNRVASTALTATVTTSVNRAPSATARYWRLRVTANQNTGGPTISGRCYDFRLYLGGVLYVISSQVLVRRTSNGRVGSRSLR